MKWEQLPFESKKIEERYELKYVYTRDTVDECFYIYMNNVANKIK
jgi:hypothetical protein